MTFAEEITRIPYAPKKPEAEGFLAPFTRAMGHVLYTLASVAVEEPTMTDEEMLNELEHARGHWGVLDHGQALSAPTAQAIANYGDALNAARDEWAGWDRTTRLRNTRDLANRAVGVAALLDRELLGIRTADPGTHL